MDLDKPIVPAPNGYIVDLQNPQRRGEAVITWVGIVGMGIATILLLIRAYTKVVLVKKMASDDWCLLVAWIFSMPVQSLIVYRAPAGLIGIHAWELTGHQLNTIARITLTTTVLYSPALAFAKLSFLCLYLNINPATGFRTGVYFTMFVVIGSCVGIVVSLLAACKPFAKNVDVMVKEGQCLNKAALYIATAALNIITDLMVIVLPIPMVLGLQMSRSRKVMLVLLFSVGFITCITSAVRVALLPPMLTTKDSSWDTVYPSLWILIEASMIIITGTLPTMRLFLKHVAPTLVGETEATQPSTTRRHSGWELQHRGTHDPYEIEDGSSERGIFPTKDKASR
ncbi:integral membrane protein [Stagonosporopsis vannaccii]|nr:integral membrane protein [Stagonosporopsis vannaccii]